MTNETFLTEALTVAVRQMRLMAWIEELYQPKDAATLRVVRKMAKLRDYKDRVLRETVEITRDLLEG